MQHFTEMAKTWDTPEKVERNIQYANEIKQFLSKNEHLKILDIGCGTGLLGGQFLNETNTLIGVDTSSGMLEVFNGKFQGINNSKSYLMDMTKENLPETGFDLIVSAMAFHHIKDTYPMLSILKEKLNTNGILAIIDLDEEDGSFHPDPKNMGVHHFGFSAAQNTMWAKETGIELLKRTIVHTVEKNEKAYPIFLAVYKK